MGREHYGFVLASLGGVQHETGGGGPLLDRERFAREKGMRVSAPVEKEQLVESHTPMKRNGGSFKAIFLSRRRVFDFFLPLPLPTIYFHTLQ